jgi:chloramphenicol-sensitive protein RarD
MYQKKSENIIGIWYAVGAFTIWGFLPLYWKSMNMIPSPQILAHRIFWSFLFTSLFLSMKKRWPEVREAFSLRRNKFTSLCSAAILGVNWFIYIWAVNANHIVETSMGYFISPLINVMLGLIVFRERLTFWQGLSVSIAFIGVFYLTLQYGNIPWIAISLAMTFAVYALLRKIAHVGSTIGLLAETAALTPIALTYIFFQHLHGNGAFGRSPVYINFFLAGSGIVTALSLIWFAHGARRIPLSTVGFIQYLAPTLNLFIGVVVFKEPFTAIHLISLAVSGEHSSPIHSLTHLFYRNFEY